MDVGYGAGIGTPIYRKPKVPKPPKQPKPPKEPKPQKKVKKVKEVKIKEKDLDEKHSNNNSEKKIKVFFRTRSTRKSDDSASFRGSLKSSVGSTQSGDSHSNRNSSNANSNNSRPVTAEIVVEEIPVTPVEDDNDSSRSIQSLPLPPVTLHRREDANGHINHHPTTINISSNIQHGHPLRRLKSEPPPIQAPLVDEIHLHPLPSPVTPTAAHDWPIHPHSAERPVHPLEREHHHHQHQEHSQNHHHQQHHHHQHNRHRHQHQHQQNHHLLHPLDRPIHPLERVQQESPTTATLDHPPAYNTLNERHTTTTSAHQYNYHPERSTSLQPLDRIGRPAPDLKLPIPIPERRRPPLEHSPVSDTSSTMNGFSSSGVGSGGMDTSTGSLSNGANNTATSTNTMPPPPARHKQPMMEVSEALGNNSLTPSLANSTQLGQNPQAVYAHIHEVSNKRMSTLDYLRKTHEGRVYWYNTLLYSRTDISRLPSFEPRRLARKATNFLLLGLSLPVVLDMNANSAPDFLRALNALLAEFDSYQALHPADGSAGGTSATSLSRARLPQMFKRSAIGKTRRSSSAANEIGLPLSASDPSDLKTMTSSTGLPPGSSSTVMLPPSGLAGSVFGAADQDLLPGEEYQHLQTPSIPFDPDFFETFATLCDVLIDCYWKLLDLIASPAACTPGIADAFGKVDSKLRKVIVQGIVKEFEDATRAAIKTEVGGIGKVVLGGLM